jgi:hypothetical protein
LFYGTANGNGISTVGTNDAIMAIANEFSQRQKNCRDPHSPSTDCSSSIDPVNNNQPAPKIPVNLPPDFEPVPMIITAMSLPWGD